MGCQHRFLGARGAHRVLVAAPQERLESLHIRAGRQLSQQLGISGVHSGWEVEPKCLQLRCQRCTRVGARERLDRWLRDTRQHAFNRCGSCRARQHA
jgi:hypothetical protein